MSTLSLLVLLAGAVGAVLATTVIYTLWLLRARPEAVQQDDPCAPLPSLDIVVAVFNERRLLPGKLHNLARLAYPGPLRFIIVDGGSTDGSGELALAWARRDSRFFVLATARPDKAAQLNLALRHARAPWIVVSDVDARLREDALTCLMTAARCDPSLGVIGSPVIPVNVHPAEQMYWRLLNWLRQREWRRGSASMVMAPCYAFKRTLIDGIPDDVVSDDVHVAWRAGSLGHAIGLAGTVVHEVRGPVTLRGLFRQKCRRGAGTLREVFRFLPASGGMLPALRAAFWIRTALFLIGPVVVLTAALLGWIALTRLPVIEAGAVAAMAAACGGMLLRPLDRSRVRKPLALFALLALSATVSLLMYPFSRQSAFFSLRTAWLRPKDP